MLIQGKKEKDMDCWFDDGSNWEFGILITIILTAITMLLIKSLNDRQEFSVLSYIVAAIMCILLFFQMTRLLNAYQYQNTLSNTFSFLHDLTNVFSSELSQYIPTSSPFSITRYVCKRIVWSIIFLLLGSLGIVFTMEDGTHSPRRKRSRRRFYNENDEIDY